MTVVVIDQAEFSVAVLARPLDGLGDISLRCGFAVGGVGVAGAKGTVVAVYFADVLRQIPAAGVPGGILLEGQRAGGYGLGRIPGDEPQAGVSGSGEGSRDACRIFLQERKSIHHHRFGGDIRCGDSTVLRSFRAVIIDTPLRRSQAAFVDNERFVFRSAAKYSLHPHVVFHHVLWGHENLPPGMKLIQRRAHGYRNFENYRLRV